MLHAHCYCREHCRVFYLAGGGGKMSYLQKAAWQASHSESEMMHPCLSCRGKSILVTLLPGFARALSAQSWSRLY